LRAVRREGVNEHGRQQLSRARFTACHLPWTDDGDCACLSPGEWTQTGDTAPGERSRHPPQRRRARARNGVALQSAGSFIAGTVKAARPERSQQALPLTLTSDIRHSPSGPKPLAGSAEPGGCEAAALAECGSTTGQRSWPGAEGVQCGCAFNPFQF